MPKETFYHLKEEKKQKIIQAIENEFCRVPFAEASINRIIEEAKIPRGSFYQYFEDKEDAITLLMKRQVEQEKREFDKIVATSSDMFDLILRLYDAYILMYQTSKTARLHLNILKKMRDNNMDIESIKEYSYQICWEKIQERMPQDAMVIADPSRRKIVAKMLTLLMRTTVIEVLTEKLTVSEGREQLASQLHVIQYGLHTERS